MGKEDLILILIKERVLIKKCEIFRDLNIAHINIYLLIFENLQEY